MMNYNFRKYVEPQYNSTMGLGKMHLSRDDSNIYNMYNETTPYYTSGNHYMQNNIHNNMYNNSVRKNVAYDYSGACYNKSIMKNRSGSVQLINDKFANRNFYLNNMKRNVDKDFINPIIRRTDFQNISSMKNDIYKKNAYANKNNYNSQYYDDHHHELYSDSEDSEDSKDNDDIEEQDDMENEGDDCKNTNSEDEGMTYININYVDNSDWKDDYDLDEEKETTNTKLRNPQKKFMGKYSLSEIPRSLLKIPRLLTPHPTLILPNLNFLKNKFNKNQKMASTKKPELVVRF